MPAKASEIYTYPPDAQTTSAIGARRSCLCRFRGPGQECSQVEHRGNRAFVTIADHPNLIEHYGREKIPLGLCSMWDLQRGNPEPWVVCPHRMFYAGSSTATVENAIYQAWGLVRGDRVALWKEVKLVNTARNKRFDFTFDYVFRKVIKEDPLECDDVPYLVEVMTASTTGGGVENTFVNALTNASATTRTGINRRQVLARMMSQFIAKAQAAFEWGGKAVWIVQDLLWRYVDRSTGFNRDDFCRTRKLCSDSQTA
jgi:Restriction endonuclease NotI